MSAKQDKLHGKSNKTGSTAAEHTRGKSELGAWWPPGKRTCHFQTVEKGKREARHAAGRQVSFSFVSNAIQSNQPYLPPSSTPQPFELAATSAVHVSGTL